MGTESVRPRLRLRFTPPPPKQWKWQGVFENWSRVWVRKHFWRVREQFQSEDDALQECAVVFTRCVNLYGDHILDDKHMMALFKRAVAREWHTVSVIATGKRVLPLEPVEQVAFNDGPLYAALTRASDELKEFLLTLQTAPSDFLQIIFVDDDLAAMSVRIRRMLRIAKPVDILSELRKLLGN